MFKYEELKAFLKYAKKIAKITPLINWNGEDGIILRHDVDLDISAAYRLSRIEKKLGIRSTFFIMTTCHIYNPLSKFNRKMLSEMSQDGFEIGLHFDPTIYRKIGLDKLQKKVEFEAQILENIIGKKVTSISLHTPSINGQYPIFDGYRNAYDKKIFSSECYLSDSRMIFQTNPYEFVKRAKKQPIQILLHPMFYTKHGRNFIEILCKFIFDMTGHTDSIFRVNSTYRQLIEGNRLWDFVIKEKGEHSRD